MRRPMMVLGGLLALAALAHAQVDGRNIPSKYGAPLASQTNHTGLPLHNGVFVEADLCVCPYLHVEIVLRRHSFGMYPQSRK